MPEGQQRGPLPPGSTIGILGSGQLGRMLALAAARLGLKTHIYCEESGPAFDVATHTTKAGFADPDALSAFAGKVDAVTYEFENVAVDTARHLAGLVPVRPGARALEVAQDRLVEKQFIAALGVPVAPFRAIDDQFGRFALPTFVPREVAGVAFREEAQAIQSTHEDRQQPVDPAVNPGLFQVEEATQQFLQRIGLLVDEDEQQFVFGTQQNGLPTSTGTALAWLARLGRSGGEGAGVGACESG